MPPAIFRDLKKTPLSALRAAQSEFSSPPRRRQGAMAGDALRLPPCPSRLPLLFPKISQRCDFREPCFSAQSNGSLKRNTTLVISTEGTNVASDRVEKSCAQAHPQAVLLSCSERLPCSVQDPSARSLCSLAQDDGKKGDPFRAAKEFPRQANARHHIRQ